MSGFFDPELIERVLGKDTADLLEAAGLERRQHMHPPSLEACSCTNTNRFSIPLKREPKAKPDA